MANRVVRSERKPWNPVSEDAVPERSQTGSPGASRGPYGVEPYVPIPRPYAGGEALITTGRDPVRIPVFVDTTSPRGVSLASDINSIMNADRYSKSDANALWDQLPGETKNALTQIARSQGGRSGKALWERAVSSSYVSTKQGNPVSPWDVIQSSGGEVQGAGGSRRGSGRAAAYDGPVESVTKLSEADITRMAYDAAEALLGRQPTQAEINKIIKKTRKAETAQPDVRTQEGPGRTVTQQGLSKEGRDAILSEVLMSSPDYADYQIDSTVMDMMLNNLRRGQDVARGA
jgi:hypothetical protein